MWAGVERSAGCVEFSDGNAGERCRSAVGVERYSGVAIGKVHLLGEHRMSGIDEHFNALGVHEDSQVHAAGIRMDRRRGIPADIEFELVGAAVEWQGETSVDRRLGHSCGCCCVVRQ